MKMTITMEMMKEFSRVFGTTYNTMYAADNLLDYSMAVDVADDLMRLDDKDYKLMVKLAWDVSMILPTSDRELASFVISLIVCGFLVYDYDLTTYRMEKLDTNYELEQFKKEMDSQRG